MARSSAPVTEKITATNTAEDPLDALLEKLMLDAPHDHKHALIAGLSSVRGDVGDGGGKKPLQKKASSGRASGINTDLDEHDPWKALSDQMNEEISRQIYAELDKQLDAQMMAELEKCQEEQSRQMDEELDRQLEEQLDNMLKASIAQNAAGDEYGAYDYDSDEYGYSSEEEDEIAKLPWSEGGEGGIESLGLRQVPIEHASADCDTIPGSIFGTPKYTQEELQKMVDNLYGDGGAEKVAGPGAWGKAKWRPGGQDKKGRK